MYLKWKIKSAIVCIAVLVTVLVTELWSLTRDMLVIREPFLIRWTLSDTIFCHYETWGDSLPSAEDIFPPPDSIFFHETSCRGGLNSRQACVVESAARIHPDRNVFVLFNSPISDYVLKRSCLSKLTQFKNIKLLRVHTTEYTKGTALAEMLSRKEHNRSQFRIEHTSDMLRYVTMYKYGGVYLDTDMLLVKRLDDLGRNWVGRESDYTVNVAAMAIGTDQLGHQLVADVLESIKSDYRPDLWVHNGPDAMNRVLLKFCNTTSTSALSADICHGFQIYNPNMFYPIHYSQKEKYFSPGDLPPGASDAYAHHLWNRLSRDIPVQTGSPYDKLATKHCPTIKSMFGEQFGSEEVRDLSSK